MIIGGKLDGQMGGWSPEPLGDGRFSGYGPKYLGQIWSHIRYWRESVRKCTTESNKLASHRSGSLAE